MSDDGGGPVRLRDLVERGFSRGKVRGLVASGEWTRLRRGIYVESWRLAGGDPRGVHAVHVAGALLALEVPGAVASHESAALLHGIALLSGPADGVTLTRPPGTASRDQWGDISVRRAGLPPGDVCVVRGIPATSSARTVVDLARSLPFAAAVVSIDAALRSVTSEARLAETLAACAGRPGSGAAAKAIAASNPRARSPLETLGRLMCADGGLPPPDVSVYIGEDGSPYTEADLYWQEYRVIQERLENNGFIVVRLTWNDVVNHPARSTERIRQAFHRSRHRTAG